MTDQELCQFVLDTLRDLDVSYCPPFGPCHPLMIAQPPAGVDDVAGWFFQMQENGLTQGVHALLQQIPSALLPAMAHCIGDHQPWLEENADLALLWLMDEMSFTNYSDFRKAFLPLLVRAEGDLSGIEKEIVELIAKYGDAADRELLRQLALRIRMRRVRTLHPFLSKTSLVSDCTFDGRVAEAQGNDPHD